MRVPTQLKGRQRRINKALNEIDYALPGTVETRRTRCGKTNCRCHDPDNPQLHGPYIVWTRKVSGKTVTRTLTQDQYNDYKPWFDNARRLRQLVTDLHDTSLAITDQDPRTKTPRART